MICMDKFRQHADYRMIDSVMSKMIQHGNTYTDVIILVVKVITAETEMPVESFRTKCGQSASYCVSVMKRCSGQGSHQNNACADVLQVMIDLAGKFDLRKWHCGGRRERLPMRVLHKVAVGDSQSSLAKDSQMEYGAVSGRQP